jgi:F-type H+-transporting ATPase subunit epsilon
MSIELQVVTPEGQAFQDTVRSVVLPGTEGDFGVLEGHEVFLTALRIGEMQIERPGGEASYAALSRGFAEVRHRSVTVMVGSCEFADEIDADRAELARERAQRQLAAYRATEEGAEAYESYQDAYSRAITRIAVSKHTRS